MSAVREIFSNGGNVLSFGRTSTFLVIIFGLAISTLTILKEYDNPSFPVDVKTLHEGQVITVTKLVAKPDWKSMSDFLMWGIGSLSAILYTGGKAVAATQHVMTANRNGNPPTPPATD